MNVWQPVNGQERIGMFIHGFEGDRATWTEHSRIHEEWLAEGLIDEAEIAEYSTADFKDGVEQIMYNLAEPIRQNPGAEWILVGHSLGGLVARFLENYISKEAPWVQVTAVITIASPHQGARLTHHTWEDIEPTVERIEEELLDPIENARASGTEWVIEGAAELAESTIQIIDSNVEYGVSDNLNNFDDAPKLMGEVKKELQTWANLGENHKAEYWLGVDGDLIKELRYMSSPVDYYNVLGDEKDPTIVRMAAELLGDGNEAQAKHYYDTVKDVYKHYRTYYNLQASIYKTLKYTRLFSPYHYYLYNSLQNRAEAREQKWNKGKQALNNFGTTWAKMIDSYRVGSTTQTVPTYEYVCDGDDPFGPDDPVYNYDRLFESSSDCEWRQTGKTTRTVYYQVADKNDGVLNRDNMAWHPHESIANDNFDDTRTAYFDDVAADGGYNHFEIRRARRAYDHPDGEFEKGDENPPMGDATEWLRQL